MKTRPLLLAALTGGLAGPPNLVLAGEASPWSFDVKPYLWVASTELETRLSGLPPSTPSDVERFQTKIKAGAMVAAEVHYRSVGLLLDFAWLQLDTEAQHAGPAFSAVNLKSDFIHATAALSYRLPIEGKFHAEVLAGARLWDVDEKLEFQSGVLPGFKAAGGKSWVDPMVGVDLRYDLSRRWSIGAKGLVGGFGAAAEMAYDAFGGVSYRFTDWCSATLGYRYLHEEYDRDGFTLTTDIHGALLGLGFHF